MHLPCWSNSGTKPGKVSYVVGHGHLENDLKTYVRRIDINSHVEFIVNPPAVDPYYDQADIFLSTSIFEGLSHSVMEAMECSLPVVATDVGDNDKLVIEGRSGFLAPVKDTQTIADRLFALYDNHNLRLQMGLNGYQHLKENFSIEKFKNNYSCLIERLCCETKS